MAKGQLRKASNLLAQPDYLSPHLATTATRVAAIVKSCLWFVVVVLQLLPAARGVEEKRCGYPQRGGREELRDGCAVELFNRQ